MKWSHVLLLAALPLQPVSAGALSPYSAQYELSRDGLVLGQAEYTLSATGNNCHLFKGVAQPTGLATLLVGAISEESRFCVSNGKIRPQQYHIRQEGGDKDENYVLDFDWSRKLVRTDDGEPRAFPDNGLDPMVLQIAVRKLLKDSGDRIPTEPIQLTVVENDREKIYELAVTGEEEIKTEIGKLRTLRVERINEKKRQMRFWLAPSLDYLPVRVERQKKNSAVISMKLTGLTDSPVD